MFYYFVRINSRQQSCSQIHNRLPANRFYLLIINASLSCILIPPTRFYSSQNYDVQRALYCCENILPTTVQRRLIHHSKNKLLTIQKGPPHTQKKKTDKEAYENGGRDKSVAAGCRVKNTIIDVYYTKYYLRRTIEGREQAQKRKQNSLLNVVLCCCCGCRQNQKRNLSSFVWHGKRFLSRRKATKKTYRDNFW